MRLVLAGLVAVAVIGGGFFLPCSAQETGQKTADLKKTPASAKPGAKAPPAAAPESTKTWSSSELGGTHEPYAQISLAQTGKPLLIIHYPWSVHLRPSVEVRWLADDEADTLEIRPLLFVANLMKGQITSDVYDCRDKAAATPQEKSFKIKDREFLILGDRNLLGMPATTIVAPERTAREKPGERKTNTDGAARAVFFPLAGWSVDSRTLWLELPRAHFAKPGRIRVWFYREGNMVWWKTLAWPGER